MRPAALLLCLAATPALAEGWAMKPGDVTFNPAEIAAFIANNEVRFYDGGQSEYGAAGSYAYIYEGGDRAEGRYRIEPDGAICVDFVNGFSRCDIYVRNGQRVLLIDEKGDRYPLR